VEFADWLAVGATKAYVSKLFKATRAFIEAGADEDLAKAQSLIVLVYSAAQTVAAKPDFKCQQHLSSTETMQELVDVFNAFKAKRKHEFDTGLADGIEKTKRELQERASSIADGCSLRRDAIEAQKALEKYFGQPY